ncbi:MAG: tetratricopeptide repeat protein, partial [Curvibacter sp.]
MRLPTRLFVTVCLLTGWHHLPAQAQADTTPLRNPAVQAQPVPPPTIADLVLLLRSYQPDAERIRELRAGLAMPVPVAGEPAELARAWHRKALIAEELQEYEKRTDYLEKALAHARQAQLEPMALGGLTRVRFEHAISLWHSHSVAASQDSMLALAADLQREQQGPLLITLNFHIITNYVHLGDLESARNALARADQLYRNLSNRPRLAARLPHFQQLIETARGFLRTHEGRLDEAERSYLAALRAGERNLDLDAGNHASPAFDIPLDRVQMRNNSTRLFLGRVLIQQQRLDEAELLLREVLKNSLRLNGRNSFITGRALWTLSLVFTHRGRHAEAVVLAEWADRSLQEASISETSPARLNGRLILANALTAAGRAAEAVAIYDTIRSQISDDARLEEGFGQGSLLSIRAYILTGRLGDALRDGDNLVRSSARNFGADHYQTAEARAYRAMALQRLGREGE